MTVTIKGLTKRYGATLALDEVDLVIRSGEVHALLGHNGAGKSTLIKCLGGGVSPSSGEIHLDGTTVTSLTPTEAISNGVAVIYQHLSLLGGLSVTENLFLGQELTRGGMLQRKEQRRLALKALERIDCDVDPDALVDDLPIGQRQQVEIAKALMREARLLILDEPTAALSTDESLRLSELVLRLRKDGIAILYVTHLLGEVMRLADRATVMRNGRVVWASEENAFTKEQLVEAVSDGKAEQERMAPYASDDSTPRLTVTDLQVGTPHLQSLSVQPGEVVCLYGLIGSGRTRLMEHIAGARKAKGGSVQVDDVAVDTSTPVAALRAGIAFVPADRGKQGLFGVLPAADNVLVRSMEKLRKGPFRSLNRERLTFNEIAARMSLRPPDHTQHADRFSGGNQQKLLIARWVNRAAGTKVLLLDDPTQGVDIGARGEIYSVVKKLAAEDGLGVVFSTNEPEEALSLAHRIVVMRQGQMISTHIAADLDEESLLNLIHHDPGKAIA